MRIVVGLIFAGATLAAQVAVLAIEHPVTVPPTTLDEPSRPGATTEATVRDADPLLDAATRYMLKATGWERPPENIPAYEDAWRIGLEEVSRAARELIDSLEKPGRDRVNEQAALYLSEASGLPEPEPHAWAKAIEQTLRAREKFMKVFTYYVICEPYLSTGPDEHSSCPQENWYPPRLINGPDIPNDSPDIGPCCGEYLDPTGQHPIWTCHDSCNQGSCDMIVGYCVP